MNWVSIARTAMCAQCTRSLCCRFIWYLWFVTICVLECACVLKLQLVASLLMLIIMHFFLSVCVSLLLVYFWCEVRAVTSRPSDDYLNNILIITKWAELCITTIPLDSAWFGLIRRSAVLRSYRYSTILIWNRFASAGRAHAHICNGVSLYSKRNLAAADERIECEAAVAVTTTTK